MTRPYGEDMETMSVYLDRPELAEHDRLMAEVARASTALHATFGGNSVEAVTDAEIVYVETITALLEGTQERVDTAGELDAGRILRACDEVIERSAPIQEHCHIVRAHIANREAFDRDLAAIRALPEAFTPARRNAPHRGSTTRPARRRKPLASAKSPPRLPEADDPRPRLVDVRIALGLTATCKCGSTGALVLNGRCWACGDEMLAPAERAQRTREAQKRAAALILCPCGCGEWFIPKRKNQVYADPKRCPQRVYRRKPK